MFFKWSHLAQYCSNPNNFNTILTASIPSFQRPQNLPLKPLPTCHFDTVYSSYRLFLFFKFFFFNFQTCFFKRSYLAQYLPNPNNFNTILTASLSSFQRSQNFPPKSLPTCFCDTVYSSYCFFFSFFFFFFQF
jgi:hypothetical protein